MQVFSLEKAQNQAFRLLSLRSRSEKELRDRLLQNHSPDITDLVIQKCKDNGYLNDNTFALERTRQLALHRLRGDRAIETDLAGKGLGQHMIAKAIQIIRCELSEEEAIKKLIAKRQKKWSLWNRQEKEKMGRYLSSRGFAAGLIFEILNRQLFGSHAECEEDVFYNDDRK